MDIYALTVGRNEQPRYLKSFLENVSEWATDHFFYDDQSTDDTALIAQEYATVRVRNDSLPSFAEDEGMFRQSAWIMFEAAMEPREGDWVLVIDCDEALVGHPDRPVRESLIETCEAALHGPVCLAFHEVFGLSRGGVPLVRVDGFWGQGFAPRLFTYREGGTFTPGKVGVPAVPSYVMADQNHWRQTDAVSVLHYGYANSIDWPLKYQRYKGVPGHHPDHIESIISQYKELVPWGGAKVTMNYGDS
jgi:hypothetical protein